MLGLAAFTELRREAFNDCGCQCLLMGDFCIYVDTQSLQNSGALQPSEERRKAGKVAAVSTLETLVVLNRKSGFMTQRQWIEAQHQRRGKCATKATITALIGSN